MTKIITQYIYPPIPMRDLDWCAYYEDKVEEGGYGYGKTEKDAIKNLLDITND